MNIPKLSILFVTLLFACQAFPASPDEEARVVKAVKMAFETSDPKPLLDLYCWDGVPDDLKQKTIQMVKDLVKQPVNSVTVSLLPATEDDRKMMESAHNDIPFRSNLPMIKEVQVTRHLSDNSTSKGVFALGEKNGHFYLAHIVPVK